MRQTALLLCAAVVTGSVAAGALAATSEPAAARAAAGASDQPAPEPGPVYVRPFKPMRVSVVRLRATHAPVYFRSLLAEPAPTDRTVDACPPLAFGAAVADWAMFAARVLGFPIEMAACPPWRMQRLAK